jgi:hypothetical protein
VVAAQPGTRLSIAELARREMAAAAADAAEAPSVPSAPPMPPPAPTPAPLAEPPPARATASLVAPDEPPPASPGDPDAVPAPPARAVGGPDPVPSQPAASRPEASAAPTSPGARPEPPTSLAPLPDLPEEPEAATEIGASEPIRDDVTVPDDAPAREVPAATPSFSPPAVVPAVGSAGGPPGPAPVPSAARPTPSPVAAPAGAPREGFQFTPPPTSREALVAAHVKALRADPEGRDRRCWPAELVRTVPAATALQKGARPALVVFYDDRAKASRLAAADLWPVVLEVESKVDLILVDLTPGGPRALSDDERRLVRRYYLGYVPTTVVLGSDRVPRLLKSERVDPALVRAASLEAK